MTSRTTPIRPTVGSCSASSPELSPEPVRVRTHNLLTSGDGTPALKWGSTNAYTRGWRTAIRFTTGRSWTGSSTPMSRQGTSRSSRSDSRRRRSRTIPDPTGTISRLPTSIRPSSPAGPRRRTTSRKWGDLVEAWARHLVERYGRADVVDWPWEVWNEPDGHYWTGTIAEFCAMYDVTAAAIKRVLPEARVGGPHTCGAADNPKAEAFLRAFLTHALHGANAGDRQSRQRARLRGLPCQRQSGRA